jgi:hypothetical protein
VKRWREVRIGLVGFGLGVATTYGVAWRFMNAPDVPRELPIITVLIEVIQESHGSVGFPQRNAWDVWWETGRGSTCVVSRPVAMRSERPLVNVRTGQNVPLPHWAAAVHWLPDSAVGKRVLSSGPHGFLVERAAGWPMPAVIDGEAGDPGPAVPGEGLSLRIAGANNGDRQTILAFTPIWVGFAVDAAVYGAVWAVVLLGVGWVRSLLRVRDGLCPECRYDLTGLVGGVCPECGAKVRGCAAGADVSGAGRGDDAVGGVGRGESVSVE